jgi:hypothetical protein
MHERNGCNVPDNLMFLHVGVDALDAVDISLAPFFGLVTSAVSQTLSELYDARSIPACILRISGNCI